jgi:hypothetical protein
MPSDTTPLPRLAFATHLCKATGSRVCGMVLYHTSDAMQGIPASFHHHCKLVSRVVLGIAALALPSERKRNMRGVRLDTRPARFDPSSLSCFQIDILVLSTRQLSTKVPGVPGVPGYVATGKGTAALAASSAYSCFSSDNDWRLASTGFPSCLASDIRIARYFYVSTNQHYYSLSRTITVNLRWATSVLTQLLQRAKDEV